MANLLTFPQTYSTMRCNVKQMKFSACGPRIVSEVMHSLDLFNDALERMKWKGRGKEPLMPAGVVTTQTSPAIYIKKKLQF